MIVADLHQRRLGEVVAAVDVAPDIAGKRLAQVVPEVGQSDVFVAPDCASLRDRKAFDCAIVATSSSLERCAPTFRELLAHGASIVSTCEELLLPHPRHAALADELDRLAREHGGRLLGTGVNPGFVMDALPVFATAISRDVTHVEVHRLQDASTRRIPFQQKIGVGLDDAEFEDGVAAGKLGHVGLGESMRFIAQALNLRIDALEEDIHPVHAERELPSGLGPVRKGRICGVRQSARGFRDEHALIELRFQASLGYPDPHDRVIVQGEPPIDLVWKNGVHGDVATSSIVLNSIRPLLAAPPGLHTMATIPLVSWTAPRA
jgi:4-hydroxy-tetrahydrodipicolinate reductase